MERCHDCIRHGAHPYEHRISVDGNEKREVPVVLHEHDTDEHADEQYDDRYARHERDENRDRDGSDVEPVHLRIAVSEHFHVRNRAGRTVDHGLSKQVNENQILSVVMMSGNIVKNKLIDVDEPLNSENMLKLNMLLNTNLNGLTVSDINLALI